MTWPEDSKHYINIWEREAAENPQMSYGDTCRKQYERDFGPFAGELDWLLNQEIF